MQLLIFLIALGQVGRQAYKHYIGFIFSISYKMSLHITKMKELGHKQSPRIPWLDPVGDHLGFILNVLHVAFLCWGQDRRETVSTSLVHMDLIKLSDGWRESDDEHTFWHSLYSLPEGCSVPKLNNHRQFKYFLNFNLLLMVSWINAWHWYLIPRWWWAAAPPGWFWRWSEMISPLWPPSNQVARMREATWVPHMAQKADFPALVYVLLKTCSSVRLGKCCILLLPCIGILKALISPIVKKLA